MKLDRGGRSMLPALIPFSPHETLEPMRPWRRAALITAALGVVIGIVLLLARHVLTGFLLARGLAGLSGEQVDFRSFVLGPKQAMFNDLRVRTRAGDALFDVGQLEVRYSMHDAIWGGSHRFGIRSLRLERPTLTVVRHADGSYNLPAARVAAQPGASPAKPAGSSAPLAFQLRIRQGTVKLVDRAPVALDLREQVMSAIRIDGQITSAGQSRLSGQASFAARRSAAAHVQAWPLRLHALVDPRRGLALVRLRARAIPLRGPVGYLQHSSAVRIDDGVLSGLDVELYGLNLGLGRPADLHVGARAVVTGGRVMVRALQQPVREVYGRLTLTDDGVWSTGLTGTLAGIPLAARGGGFERRRPQLRLGIAANGDLAALRTIFAFSRRQPLAGRAQIQTLIEAPLSDILIRSAVRVPHATYSSVPLTDIAGRVDYYASGVVLDAVHARYGAAAVRAGGRFLLGGRVLDAAIAVAATAPARSLPYAENLAPEARAEALALITGGDGYRARGSMGVSGAGVAGRGIFTVDARGVGDFGPFLFERGDGSSLVGALRLERPTSLSAGWLSARGYRVDVPHHPSTFAGLSVPAFPPVAGIIDASLAGGGQPSSFGLVGQLRGHNLSVAAARLGTGDAQIGGNLRDVRISRLHLDGPVGRFSGDAAVAGGAFAMRGAYDGSLERLVPLTGNQLAHGAVRGSVIATLAGRDIVVQSSGAALRRGSIRGVALDAAAGTLALRGNAFHLIVAAGSIGGRHAVARESAGAVAVSAPDLPAAALRGTALPLEAGNFSVFGIADLRRPAANFDGTVTVADGRSRGYRVAGDAQLDLDGPHATISAATGALGSTYGSIGGSIGGIGERVLRYDLDMRVPVGDVDLLQRDLGLRLRHLGGSFNARLRVRGAGARPIVVGTIEVPEGVYNGLAFRDAAARLVLDAEGAAAQDGSLAVGSTQGVFAASVGAGRFGLSARASRADLADFNDYFDAGDTLAGQGGFDVSVRSWRGGVVTHGFLDFAELRYRDFRLGDTRLNWHMNGSAIAGHGAVVGAAGTLAAHGTVIPAPANDLMGAFHDARYDIGATLGRIDLGTWLPAAGFTQPVLGLVDARLHVAGRVPHLAAGLDATLTQASAGGLPIRSASLRATSMGSRVNVLTSTADLGFGQLSGAGKVGFRSNDPLAFDLRGSTADISQALHTFIPAVRGRLLAGALEADVRLGGTLAAPTVAGGFDLTNARYGAFVVPRAIGAVALAGRALELRDADVEFTRGQAFVAGSLPLQLQPFALGPPHAPLSFDVTVRNVDLAQFAPLLPAGTKLGGTLDGRVGVEGTVDRPRLLGALAVSDGSYLSKLERAPIQHFDARLAFAGSTIALEAFHAGVGSGTLDAGGSILLPLGANSAARYDLNVRARAAVLDFPAYGHGTLDGMLRLTGGPGPPLLAGDLAVRDALIPVSAVYGSASGPAGIAGSGAAPINPTFAIHAAAGNNVRLHSSIVDIGLTGGANLSGSLRAPRLDGAFTATDGTVSSYNHVFRILNASATFDPADGILPTIDARAAARVTNPDRDRSRNIAGTANIIVTVTGTPDSNNLQVIYSSDPPYSQEQIVGLLFDVPALLGAVNFNLNGRTGSTALRGAPGETNALLPPGVTPEQISAISLNQEVFSLLNGQFTQRALSPIERVFEKVFGLSELEFTVDYGGGIGYSLRRQIGKRNFYAFLSQTVTYPERSNFGFELEPKPFESVNFSYYQQNGITSLITNQTPGELFTSGSTRRLISVQPLGNRSGLSLNFNRRF